MQLAVDEFRESGALDAQGRSSLRDSEAERLDTFAENNGAGVRWILHRHEETSLAVIEIIDLRSISEKPVAKAESLSEVFIQRPEGLCSLRRGTLSEQFPCGEVANEPAVGGEELKVGQLF